jgi:hypothetical protein
MKYSNIDLNFNKDADITEVLGMDEKFKEMENEVNANASESQKVLNKRVYEIHNFIKNTYNSRLYHIKQDTISQIYVR